MAFVVHVAWLADQRSERVSGAKRDIVSRFNPVANKAIHQIT
jgi:hypothetical protein